MPKPINRKTDARASSPRRSGPEEQKPADGKKPLVVRVPPSPAAAARRSTVRIDWGAINRATRNAMERHRQERFRQTLERFIAAQQSVEPKIVQPATPSTTLLTVKEASAYLALHEKTIRRMIRTHRLPASRTPGGQLRIQKQDLLKHT